MKQPPVMFDDFYEIIGELGCGPTSSVREALMVSRVKLRTFHAEDISLLLVVSLGTA